MKKHGPGPGVKDGERTDARAEETGIVGKFL
jgi:hypothetical protein